MKITESDRDFICKNIPDAVSLINAGDADAVLCRLYEFIDHNGFAPPHYDEYNATGRKAQGVYDRIYEANFLDG